MKLDNKDSSTTMNQLKREKSREDSISNTKDSKLKQDKSQKEKDKKEKERIEKEKKKEKERLEKEKKEKEKKQSKKQQQQSQQSTSTSQSRQQLQQQYSRTSSLSNNNNNAQFTTNNANEQQQQIISSTSSNNLNNSNLSSSAQMPTSKSENMLSRFKKQTSIFSNNSSSSDKSKSKSSKLGGGGGGLQDTSMSKQQIQDMQPPSIIAKNRYRCQVVYLDESVKPFDIDKNAIGDDLMVLVCNDLELVEREYFSLTYRDVNNMKFWLDHEKKIKDQLKGNISSQEPVFNFEVKFYPPEPHVLQEELTRYLLTLQLRHDIMDGKLPCTFVTHALLGSYTVQAELGDFDELNNTNARYNINGLSGFEYLEGFCFAPNQTPELLAAIAECHKDHKGQSPAEAEMHFLENAVKLAMYGVDLHNAKDSDGIDILVGVSASGLLVFRDHLRINRFAWPKILKISYKRNHFYLKLRPSEFEKYETTIGFRCPNHKAAKRLWKIAVEHHAFFRLREPEKKNKGLLPLPVPNFNSKFRYTGNMTYMQSRHRSIDRNQPAFTRSLSKRLTQSMDRGLAYPNDTPGSVQSAAANHFSRMKPHQSISNLPNRQLDLRESQEDLDIDQGDYNVADDGNFNVRGGVGDEMVQQQPQQPAVQTQPQTPQYQHQQLQQDQSNRLPSTSSQQATPRRTPFIQGPGFVNQNANNNNQLPFSQSNLETGLNASYNSSRNPSYLQQQAQQQTQPQLPSSKKFNTISNLVEPRLEPIEQSDTNSFDQLEDYYTRVDTGNLKDDTRLPSYGKQQPGVSAQMPQNLENFQPYLGGTNKVSTPILDEMRPSSSQRYVPTKPAQPPPSLPQTQPPYSQPRQQFADSYEQSQQQSAHQQQHQQQQQPGSSRLPVPISPRNFASNNNANLNVSNVEQNQYFEEAAPMTKPQTATAGMYSFQGGQNNNARELEQQTQFQRPNANLNDNSNNTSEYRRRFFFNDGVNSNSNSNLAPSSQANYYSSNTNANANYSTATLTNRNNTSISSANMEFADGQAPFRSRINYPDDNYKNTTSGTNQNLNDSYSSTSGTFDKTSNLMNRINKKGILKSNLKSDASYDEFEQFEQQNNLQQQQLLQQQQQQQLLQQQQQQQQSYLERRTRNDDEYFSQFRQADDDVFATNLRQEQNLNEQNLVREKYLIEQNAARYQYNVSESQPNPVVKTPIYRPVSGQDQPSPSVSERIAMINQPGGISSFRKAEQPIPQQAQQQQQQFPQPIARRQPPPPIPTDRSSNRTINDSYKYNQQQQQQQQQYGNDDEEYLSRQMRDQRIGGASFTSSQQQSQQASYRQGMPTQYIPAGGSRTASNTSTPDVNKVKKQIFVNEQVNHKDLLLRAIQMATELDPNLEVEKVEITTEE